MKALLLISLLLLVFNRAQAVDSNGYGYTIEPIYGLETVYRDTPTPHTSTSAIYGARVSAGKDLLSGQLEYTKGSDIENYSTQPEKVQNDDEALKLGILSTLRFGSYFFISGRAGGQASQTTTTTTTSGVAVKDKGDIAYNPYGGASLGLKFGPISVSAGSTVVFKDINKMDKNTYQDTISISISH